MNRASDALPEPRHEARAASSTALNAADGAVTLLGALAAAAIVALVSMVGFEVVSRTFFDEPTSWATEYGTYAMIIAAFLGLGYAHATNSHVRADILLATLAPSRRRTLELVGAWSAAAFVAVMAWQSALHVWADYVHDTRVWGVMQTPLWVPKLCMPIGLIGLLVAMLAEIPRLPGAAHMGNGVRRALPTLLFAATAVVLPLLHGRVPGLGVFDAATVWLLLVVLGSAAAWSGWRIALQTAAVLVGLGLLMYFARGAWTGYGLVTLLVATLVMLVLGIRIAFAIGLIGTAGLLLLVPMPQLQVLAERGWSSVDSFSLAALPMFVLMGAFLLRSGASEVVFSVLAHKLRRVPAGLAHASVGASAVFAAISGSSVATAATIGAVACPEMDRRGYSTRLSHGVVAAGGTLGILIPPSIPLLIYGSTMGVAVPALFIAGIIPGVILSVMFMLVVAVWAKLWPVAETAAPEVPPSGAIWRLVPVGMLMIAVLGSMYFGIATPTEAGGVGSLAALALCLTNREFSRGDFRDSLLETVKVTSFLLMIIVATGIMTYLFDYLRAAVFLVDAVKEAQLAPWLVALLIAGCYVILGMFIDPVSMMLITLPVTFPLAISLGHDPVWFGIVLVLLIELGLITPPVGMNLFVLKGLSPHVKLGDITAGALAFVMAIFALLMLVYFYPAIITWLPSQMK